MQDIQKASFSAISRASTVASSRLRPGQQNPASGFNPDSGHISPLSGLSSRRSSQVSSSSGGFSRSARASILSGGTFDLGTQQQQQQQQTQQHGQQQQQHHHHQHGPRLDGSVSIVGAIDTGESAQVIDLCYSETGSHLISALSNGLIKAFNPTSGNLTSTLESGDLNSPLSRIRCKPYQDGQANSLLAATYVSGHLVVWNSANGLCLAQARDENPESEYLCLSYNPFVDVIAVGLSNGNLKLYDEKTMQVVSLLQKSLNPTAVNGHTDRVMCVANHPNNPHEFVSAGWDDSLQVWDARAPNAVRSIRGVLVCGEGLTFDRKGRDLMVAAWRGHKHLQMVDYSQGKVVHTFDTHLAHDQDSTTYLTAAKFIGKDFIVIGGSNRGSVRILDRHKNNVVASISDIPHVYSLDVAKKQGSGTHKFAFVSQNHIALAEYKK